MSNLFPYPTVSDGTRSDGTLVARPDNCRKCRHHECESKANDELKTCSYGIDYICLMKDVIVNGIIVKDAPTMSSAKRKALKQNPDNHVRMNDIRLVIKRSKSSWDRVIQEAHNEKRHLVDSYASTRQFEAEFLEDIRDRVLKGLSFLHDYRQINSQIAQNINVILERRYREPQNDSDDIKSLLDKATHEERAIYWASKFLEQKITTAKFLLSPEFINNKVECCSFSLHGLVLKYVRIYQLQFDKKNVKITLSGQSYKNIAAVPDAVGVILHTLIDNALKYAPSGSNVYVMFEEKQHGILLSVESYGPKIDDDEFNEIFSAFYRGRNAIGAEEEGAGYGLYIAQFIARKHLNSEIAVSQANEEQISGVYRTTFSICVPEIAPVCVGI